MVSHSHLSKGNSESSQSHDLFAEYGVSNPSSPSISSLQVLRCEDMMESDPIPAAISVSSDESISLDNVPESNLGLAFETNVQDIFKVVQHFSQKDRDEALFERKKNFQIMDFLNAHGITMNDVNAFTAKGKKVDWEHACKVLDKSPSVNNTTFGGQLAPVFCDGDQSKPERMVPSPISPKSAADMDYARVISNSNFKFTPVSPLEEGELPRQPCGVSKSWSDIVSNIPGKSSRSLSYHPPLSENGNILVKPPSDVLKRGNQLWSSSLVGYFLHSNLPFNFVEPLARRLWGNMGLTKVFLHSKGYYIFKFQSLADRDNVLASGPWHFSSKIIVLHPWHEGVEFAKTDRDKFPIWVKLSQIPLSYWSDEGISYIASAIGKPLITDDMTSKNDYMNFARVCIEVKATFSFPSTVNVVILNEELSENTIVPVEVEYQSRPPFLPSL